MSAEGQSKAGFGGLAKSAKAQLNKFTGPAASPPAEQSPPAQAGDTPQGGGYLSNVGSQLKDKVQSGNQALRQYARPFLGDNTNKVHPAVDQSASPGVMGFLKKQVAAGRQFMPNISKQVDEDGSQLVEVTTNDFNLKVFEEKIDASWSKKFAYLSSVSSVVSYFLTFGSDVYAAYQLYIDPAFPKPLFGAYVVIIIISWILSVFELSIAKSILDQDDLSATIIDDLTRRFYQVKSWGHFGLVQTVLSDHFGCQEKVFFFVLSGLNNAKRLIFVAIPQIIVVSLALKLSNTGGAVNLKTLVSLSVNMFTLSADVAKIWCILYFYACVRCCAKKDMSLWDNLNLRVEKSLNKMLKKHPEYASVGSENPNAVSAPPAEV